ncbi:MAG: autotransporter-associated beta strand repeat-containing protein [Pirellulales bacterium]
MKGSAGNLTLNGANTYSGGTTVNGGTLIGAAANSIQGNFVNNGTVRFSANHTYSGNMSGSGSVDIASGDITFTGNNSYTGGTTVSNASLTTNSAGLSGPVTLNDSFLTFVQQSNGTFNGSVSGTGVVIKVGSGELVLANASTYSGTFEHQVGSLGIGDNQSFGTSQVNLASGTTVRADGAARIVNNSVTIGNNVTFSGNQDLTFTNVAPINLGIGQNLTSTNSGTTTLVGKFDGAAGSVLSVSNGTLAIGNSQSFVGFRSAGLLDIGPGATLKILSAGFADVSPQTELSQGRIIADNGIALGASKNLIGNGVVDAKIAAAQGSIISATTGNLTIGKATSVTGFVSDGELYTNQYTVTINDANQAVLGSLTQLGNSTGAGTLTAGTALAGQTSMHFLLEEGKNLVGHGTVNGNFKNQGDVIGDGTALSDRIVFESDWIVKGNGSFTNTLIKGTYSPGNSPAIVTGLNQAFAGKIEFELGGLLPGFNANNHDQLNDLGTISLLGGTILKISQFSNFTPHLGDSFQIMSWQTGLNGLFSGVEIDPFFSSQGLDFKLNYSNTGGPGVLSLLIITAVPEPSSLAMLVVAVFTLGWRRPRARQDI